MSEDFDKEAERERLREKYERDKKKREATEQMSELLLQGATMTNAHCSDCGDPIFRYDGQEFCPTCEKPVDRGTGEDGGDAEDAEDTADDEGIEVTTPSDDARVAFGEGQDEGEAADAPDEAATGEPQDANQSQPPERASSNAAGSQPSPNTAESQAPEPPRQPAPRQSEPQPRTGERQPQRGSTAATAAGGADADAAREALVETLTRFSRKAAATEDPNRAREHLAAAREAAEALSALRQ